MVAQTISGLDLVQFFQPMMRARRYAKSSAGNFGREDRVLFTFRDSARFPFFR